VKRQQALQGIALKRQAVSLREYLGPCEKGVERSFCVSAVPGNRQPCTEEDVRAENNKSKPGNFCLAVILFPLTGSRT
jgi:hypothetical protein